MVFQAILTAQSASTMVGEEQQTMHLFLLMVSVNGKEHFVMIFGPEIEYGSEEHLAAIEKAKVLDEHRRLRQRALNAELAEVSYDDPQWYEKTFTIECKYA
jgi:hypothetical protein